MRWTPLRDGRVQGALLFALLALAVLLREGRHAFAVDDVPTAPALVIPARSDATRRGGEVPVARLVALAPFSPERRVAVAGVARPAVTAMADVPGALRLIGTVSDGSASFAVCQLGATPPRMVHPGDTVGGWQLQQVAPGRATFVDAARTRHELRLSPMGN